jgi:hypothetical protein
MKKYFIIVMMFILAGFTAFAQDDDDATDDKGAAKLRERMRDYVQKRLNLSKAEAEKFSPLFLRYLVELRKTHRENRGDRPVMQLKVAELRVKFRNEFRQVIDEQRANKVFVYQREFEIKIIDELRERRAEKRGAPLRTNKTVLLD